MPYARRRSDEPPEERDLDAILADCEAAREVFTAAARQLAEMAGQPYSQTTLMSATTGLRQGQAALDRYVKELHAQRNSAVVGGIAAAMRSAAEPRRVPSRRRRGGRHAAGLEVIPGGRWTPAALSGPAALKAAGLLTATAASIAIAAPISPSRRCRPCPVITRRRSAACPRLRPSRR